MSLPATIYDEILTRLATIFPTHQRLPLERVEANPEIFLKKGYGMLVTSSTAETGNTCMLTYQFVITIPITRQIYETELEIEHTDTERKNLLDDAHALIKSFETNPYLSSNAGNMIYTDGSGHVPVFDDKNNYIKMEINFRLRLNDHL